MFLLDFVILWSGLLGFYKLLPIMDNFTYSHLGITYFS